MIEMGGEGRGKRDGTAGSYAGGAGMDVGKIYPLDFLRSVSPPPKKNNDYRGSRTSAFQRVRGGGIPRSGKKNNRHGAVAHLEKQTTTTNSKRKKCHYVERFA